MTFNELRKKAKTSELAEQAKTYKLAILGGHATQFLRKALEMQAKTLGIKLEVYEAEYNQIEREIIDESSELYSFAPDAVMITYSTRKLRSKFYDLTDDLKTSFAAGFSESLNGLIELLSGRMNTKVLLCNQEELNDNVFGQYGGKNRISFFNQLRRLNVAYMDVAEQRDNTFLVDVQNLWSTRGDEFCFEPSMYVNADLIFSLDFCAVIAEATCQIIENFIGKFKKCVILDLDNTTWGGIIGDDGMSGIQIGDLGIGKAFTEFQKWVKQLKNRGIIVAVCSKNTESIAKEPFEKHPDMVLRLEDISVFVANWENKADNIRYIQEVLNIGFDSMVFFDDNPAEREIVRANVPGVCVPELPEDPADYLPFASGLNLFETISYSANDSARTKQYQEEASRKKAGQSYTNMTEFLGSLEMSSDMKPFDEFDIPRIAQLSQRSNQFNLRTIRYTEDEVKSLSSDGEHLHYSVRLKDKFGDYGLVSVLILKKVSEDELFIDTWIMSCRVLKRGLEKFVLNRLAADGAANGFKLINGEYLPTPKNELVKDHYKDLGFEKNADIWTLDLAEYNDAEVFIKAE